MTVHSPPPQAAYDDGLELLGRQEAGLALPRLEEALQESLAQMESCRAGCEGPEEQQREEEEEEGAGSQGGLYETIAGKELGIHGPTEKSVASQMIHVCCLQATGFGSCSAASAVWETWPRVLDAASLSLTSFPAS